MKAFFITLLFSMITAFAATAQLAENRDVEMADQMRAEGKIYVVVAVVLIIFVGMILYLISLDKKISKIEKEKSGI
jgi:hypothetical protein